MRESCTSGSERGKPRKGLTYLPNFSEFSYRTKTLRGMRTAAYEVDVALRPPQARVSQAKLFVLYRRVHLIMGCL